jgi:signal transduction histidine kinase
MAERLQSLIGNERQLLRDISHELRSPLARLNIALGIARQHEASPDLSEPLGRIEHESERLNELIQELLTLTRLEAGIDSTQTREVDLSEVLSQVVSDAQFEAQARNVTVELANTAACRVAANPELLRRAVENVIRNAVAYTTANTSVQVALHRRKTDQGAVAEIIVRDHGKGIPDHALTDVFRPFYRIEAGRDRTTGGVGLGLAITDRAVRAHGGTVIAQNANDSDGGLIVTILLPAV